MKKEVTGVDENNLREEYDLSLLKGGVRGKYYDLANGGNIVCIDPDLASMFPDAASVNRALRMLAETARAATTPIRSRKA